MVEDAPVLEVSELAYLLVRIEQAVQETAAGFRRGMFMIAGLFLLIAVSFAVQQAWAAAAFGALFGGGMVVIGMKASTRTSPEKMKPVLDALRDAPERITLVRHYQTSDSRKVFVTDWLELKTAEHRLVIKAKHDWERLYRALGKRCPVAKFVA
jgi:type IV secretory pathway TrbD component